MLTVRPSSSRTPAPPRRNSPWQRYVEDTRRPLYCLLFLFPLVATYEFGTLIVRPEVWPERELVATSLIRQLLGWFGAHGMWLPAAALLLTLLIWHLLERHPWRVRLWVLVGMAIESVVLTVPLFVMGQVLMVAESGPSPAALRQHIVLALGAGVYEELVFRLYLVAGLALLLETVLRTPHQVSRPLVIVLSAGVFAGCHFQPIGCASFEWKHFVLLLLGGAYLALVFLGRGLGVAAGCHVAFNLLPLLTAGWRG
ncbi:MAG: CPBP family glutamic-type intramembrane protease [Phycisphaerae bacterium]